jgi:hypothetical protein
LPVTLELPSKKIFLQLQQFAKDHQEYDVTDDPAWSVPVGSTHPNRQWKYAPAFANQVINDLEGSQPYLSDNLLQNPPLDENATIFFWEPSINIDFQNFQYRIRFKGTFKSFGSANRGYDVQLRVRKRDAAGVFTILHLEFIHSFSGIANNTVPFDILVSGSVGLEKNEGLFCDIFIQCVKFTTGTHNMSFQMDDESEIYLSADSLFRPTDAKLFLVNEAWSRTAEAITNDQLRVFSTYFGRTDSQPYATIQNGSGSLEAITKGIFIRGQENRIPDETAVMGVSMKSLWEGLNPIHNIGLGIEPDPARPGKNRIRIEKWNHFYSNEVILYCLGVDKIEMEAVPGEIFSVFEFGYQKWEAEQYNGLDELLTKRKYRTKITSVQNQLTQISNMIASGYAIEITRREGNSSKDWRYDNETFIICLKKSGSNLVVDLGNCINSANIYDPATLYNYRISPVRNALRWLNKILATYLSYTNGKIIFTDGNGNYFAEGELESTFGKLEAGVLKENQELSLADLSIQANGIPILRPERVNFRYPLSAKEFKEIKAKPLGKIFYEGTSISGYGWIDTINYTPNEGVAQFKLIPEIV